MNISKRTKVIGTETYEVYYITRSWFIFQWKEIVSTRFIGRDLFIETEHPINNIYFNSIKLNNQNPI